MFYENNDLGTVTFKKYLCKWVEYSGIRYIQKRARYIHADNMAEAKNKCLKLYGSYPTNIVRV